MPFTASAKIDKTQKFVKENIVTYDELNLKKSEVWDIPIGMARGIWEDKYARRKEDGSFQTWPERVTEVVSGSFSLLGLSKLNQLDVDVIISQNFKDTLKYALKGILSFSGRHLQHGDLQQPYKKLEKLSNCSTAIMTFMTFKLGLDGSGVGSDYSCATRRANWDNCPNIRVTLSREHPDFIKADAEFRGSFDNLAEARNKYPSESENVRWFKVEDTCEGWVQAIAALETASFHERHKDKLFIFDFSDVREEGRPIMGQQGRPSSGPLPLMRALMKISSIRGAGMQPWKQALYIDDYLASSTILGGVRRMARMATKWWKDKDIFEFIEIKRDSNQTGILWTANHSILVDAEFWEQAKDKRTHAFRVFQAATAAAYMDRTGEPGFINVDKLNARPDTLHDIDPDQLIDPDYFGNKLHPKTLEMVKKVYQVVIKQPYFTIVNPCSEIALSTFGGYCIVGDINGGRVNTEEEFINASKYMAEFLIRTNLMKAAYKAETLRTNRIGVSIIGIFEMMYNLFGITVRDIVDNYDYLMEHAERPYASPVEPSSLRSAMRFCALLAKGRDTVEQAANEYSSKLGLNNPHSYTCLKPGGTVSKVMAVTESANLPAFPAYMRWVQYENNPGGKPNEALADLVARGYPVKDISAQYSGKSVVGFPTILGLVEKMPEDYVVTSTDLTPEEHYKWLSVLEKFWLGDTDEHGAVRNNMLSYTMKFNLKDISYEEFFDTIMEWQPKIRCCAFDAVQDIGTLNSKYVYVPEEPITRQQALEIKSKIIEVKSETYDEDELQCASGICPIEPSLNKRKHVTLDEENSEEFQTVAAVINTVAQ